LVLFTKGCSAFIFRVILHCGDGGTAVLEKSGNYQRKNTAFRLQQTVSSYDDVPNWTKSLCSSSLPIHSDCLNGCLKPLLHADSRKLRLMLIGSGYQLQLPADCYTTWWGAVQFGNTK